MPFGGERADKQNTSDRISRRVKDSVKLCPWNREISGLLRRGNR
jgi:hypothetical protein